MNSYTIWLLIITLSIVVFINRYIFLDPNIKIKIPNVVYSILKYSAPCLLAAICAPIVFFQSNEIKLSIVDPYIIASIITIIFSIFIKKTITVVILGLTIFYLLLYFL